jgi:hypothetical protein
LSEVQNKKQSFLFLLPKRRLFYLKIVFFSQFRRFFAGELFFFAIFAVLEATWRYYTLLRRYATALPASMGCASA